MLYCGALAVLFLTPGPVWVALIARALSGGFHAAWPLALGVAIGDMFWPLLAILGITWILEQFAGFMTVLRYSAVLIFVYMGWVLIRNANKGISENSKLTRPGMLAGFLAGIAVILGNPKAILFYMGALPNFFDITAVTWIDIAVIMAASVAVPLLGNVILAYFLERTRRLLTSPRALWRMNVGAGVVLILVGLVIPLVTAPSEEAMSAPAVTAPVAGS